MAEQIPNATDILSRYKRDNDDGTIADAWHDPLPVLSAEEAATVQTYLTEKRASIVASSWPYFELGKASLKWVVANNTHAIAELDNHADTVFLGPLIIQGEYRPDGAAVWKFNEEVHAEDRAA